MRRGVRWLDNKRAPSGFSLVELIIVIALIATLLSLLLPAAARTRHRAAAVHCQSNLRQLGDHLLMYAQQWNGWIIPPRRGFEVAIEERWPAIIFRSSAPRVLVCPADHAPAAGISYVLNWHLVNREVRFGQMFPAGLSPSNIVIAGEKQSHREDYYLNANDYADGLLAMRRHGRMKGMNMLYLDLHVGVDPPMYQFSGQWNPWDVPGK